MANAASLCGSLGSSGRCLHTRTLECDHKSMMHQMTLCMICCSIFLECVDGGTLEWNALTNQPVYFHMNITGYISAAPADDRILVTASNYNWATVLTPLGMAINAPDCLNVLNLTWQGAVHIPSLTSAGVGCRAAELKSPTHPSHLFEIAWSNCCHHCE